VRADLMSSNMDAPRALGGSGMPPQKPPAPPGRPPLPPEGDNVGRAQADVLSRVSVGETHDGKFLTSWESLYTMVKDDLYPIKVVEERLLKGGTLEAAEGSYGLARMTRGAAGKATQFLEHATFDWDTYKNTGPGLKQITKPHNQDLDGLRAYMVSRRANELHAQGIETGIDPAAAQLVVKNGKAYEAAFEGTVKYQNALSKYLKDSGLLSEEGYLAMLEANKDYVPMFRVFADKKHGGAGAGLSTHNPIKAIKGSQRLIIDPIESIIKNTYVYTALAERNAVGRAMGDLVARDVVAAEAIGIKPVKATMRPIHLEAAEIRKLFDEFLVSRQKTSTQRTEKTTTKGADGASTEPTNKIYEANKARVEEALTSRGFTKNEAETMMRRLSTGVKESSGKTAETIETLVKEVTTTERVAELDIRLPNEAATIFRPNAMAPAPNQIRYYVDGKAKTLELPPEVAEAFGAADAQSANMLLQIIAVPARTLRAGAILSPDFMGRNTLRDQLTAFSFSRNGYIPLWDMMSGLFSLVKKDGQFQNWLKSGGANSSMVSLDRNYLQQHILKLDRDTGLMRRAWNVVSSPIEVLRITSELIENSTRLGDFKKAGATTKREIQNAGFGSREVTLDFQRIGSQTRGLNMIAAFMNAGLEGFDRTVRAFKDNPVGTTAKVAASVTLPSVLLWYANNSTPERQERYREIPHWQRDLFWIVMTEDNTYRIPKPFEVGVIFGSGAERLLDQFVGNDPRAMQGFGKAMAEMGAINIAPTGAVPILEQMSNYSFFTTNPLIPSRMENLLPEYQYNEYTTETSKAIGRLIGAFPGMHDKSMASPIVIDNYISGWTGTLGRYVRDALDYSLRKNGILPDPSQPLATLADIPFIKSFVVRYPSATAQSVSDFYAGYISRNKAYMTFQHLVQQGNVDAAMREMEIEPGAFERLEGLHQAIGTLNHVIRMTYRDPEMTPSDKRQLIDEMYHQMILMAREGVQQMNKIDEVVDRK
jgi:hypothetical protein